MRLSTTKPAIYWLESQSLLDLALEVLTLHQVGDIILIVVLLLASLVLLHVLVALGQLAEGGEAVGAELVQDAGDELGEFLFLAVAVEGEGVGGDGGVDLRCVSCFPFLFLPGLFAS